MLRFRRIEKICTSSNSFIISNSLHQTSSYAWEVPTLRTLLPRRMRRSTSRFIKFGFIFLFLGFLTLNQFGGSNENGSPDDSSVSSHPSSSNESSALKGKVSSSLSGERILRLPNNTNGNSIPSNNGSLYNKEIDANNITEILRIIHELNAGEKIHNMDLFGSNFSSNETVVIVVQVHDRVEYLKELIQSFSKAQNIHSALLILSHDVWNDEINKLVRSIDFVRFMQIFYPLSIQTHPNEFPGQSPNDCPMNVKKERARELGCTNREWPDIYGHYRDAKFTQIKHHWWWKANKVFHHLEVLEDFQGLVLFLEEDHYVSEDFLPVLKLMHSEKSRVCPYCDIISLGTYLKTYNFEKDGHQVESTQWMSVKHNMGMAFTKELWRKVMGCKSSFCNFDDYNWDWSLQHVSLSCLPEGIFVMLMKGPRVFHIGECGVHHKKSNCQAASVVKKVNDILSKAKKYLYPKKLKVIPGNRKSKNSKIRKGNGGWGDLRDQKLCLDLSSTSKNDKTVNSYFY
ncbi:alpha-1,6-mannosyl-glycoprotein 2-beta-N-acetylglucosaminyltransferase isoform X2 [Lepeophtheirus salmonis]|uniref:alpha-1,6-mannosyl-glycoprotein 2-beta-N-acetylglucosaminyltransferase isoform X2 n=1 Tax=Lepeophtheirus salmonis TaxID=72036 RepID=UPI001AE43B85|nr:alpha-1,6-mannosyl-glycoprotein 2-beta-N-acetylglucosaminyltransferase-like isoform X2 [Lepeophtheirus salmonis]